MNAEFGRFLHYDIHSLAPGYALYQAYPEWRFHTAANMFAEAQIQFLLGDCVDGCGVFAAAAVKNGQYITRPETQYAPNITRLFAAERQPSICAQLNRTK